jgi:hypothetical protein
MSTNNAAFEFLLSSPSFLTKVDNLINLLIVSSTTQLASLTAAGRVLSATPVNEGADNVKDDVDDDGEPSCWISVMSRLYLSTPKVGTGVSVAITRYELNSS